MKGTTRPASRISPLVDRVDAGQALEQRALARAVAAHDAEELAVEDLEGDVTQRVKLAHRCAPKRMQRPLLERGHVVPRDPEGLRDVLDPETGLALIHPLGG